MKKLFVFGFFLLFNFSLYSGPRHIIGKSFLAPSGSVHPHQVIIFASGEADAGDNFLNTQGQQRAAYLSEFLLYQDPDGFVINQSIGKHPILAFFTPQDSMGNFSSVHALQTITPLFHQANAVKIEQTKTTNLTINQDTTLANSPEVLKNLLYTGEATLYDGATVVICWRLEQITSNPDGLFGDPEVKDYFKNVIDLLTGFTNTQVLVIKWSPTNSPYGKILEQVGSFNVP